MPKLNGQGQAVCGVGDGILSVDTVPLLEHASIGAWVDDETVLANALISNGDWHVTRCQVARRFSVPIDDGANDLAAGGNRWIAWNPKRGMFGSLGDLPQAGVLAAGRDGTLAYVPDRQNGLGFILNAPDGRNTHVPGAVVYDMQVLGPTSALWYDGSAVRVVGRPFLHFAVPPGRTRLVSLDDGDWLVYWSEGVGLIAQLDGASDGYILETRPIAFNHDAVGVRGELVVAWSTTQGEGPNDLVTKIVSRSAKRVPLVAPIPAIGRPLWCGWFHFPGAQSSPPANCVLVVGPEMIVRAWDSGAPIAHYIAGNPEGSIDALDAAIAAASGAIPKLAYWTRGPQAGRLPRGAQIIGIEAYRGMDETLDGFERRVRIAASRCPNAWLIAQGYTSNLSLTNDLAALVPIYARVARDCPNIDGILVFSAGARATGWNDHAEIHDAWRALADGLAGTPALPPAPNPNGAGGIPPSPDPLPAHHPGPPPAPKDPMPTPPGEAMTNPTYDEFVKVESVEIHEAYVKAQHHELALSDMYHNAWRRLIERWTHRDLLHDIKGEPLEDGGAGGADRP